jgi:hypothetical protein
MTMKGAQPAVFWQGSSVLGRKLPEKAIFHEKRRYKAGRKHVPACAASFSLAKSTPRVTLNARRLDS